MENAENMTKRIFNLLSLTGLDVKHVEKNFFLVKEGDEIYEITVADNIDPGAWEDL